MNDKLTYELLALDPTESVHCENVQSLLHTILGYSALWKDAKLDSQKSEICDGNSKLHISHVKPPADEESTSSIAFARAFIVTLSGTFDDIEALREPLTAYLKKQDFKILYVLKDEISQSIACQLYPLLYRIENQLRAYLIKFMTTRIGPTWWEATVSKETENKVNLRKKNERVFGKHVENSAYLVDFDDLGKMIYEQSSGFVTKDDILKKIFNIPETGDALKKFKGELQSNYQKLFKESFSDKKFKEKWQEFEALRNKIAHGNLFTAQDLLRGKELADEITNIILDADQKTEELVITEEEREAIQETVEVKAFDWQKPITREEFLRRLSSQEERFQRSNGFVGISAFLRYLTNFGYEYGTAKKMLEQLELDSVVEVYKVANPGGDYEVSAIQTLKQ